MNKHVPGPWAVCTEPPNGQWVAGLTIGAANLDDGRRICDLVWFGGETNEANGRLICAAPELLEAAEHAIAYDQCIQRHAVRGKSWVNDGELDRLYEAWINASQRAIAKAMGSPPPKPVGRSTEGDLVPLDNGRSVDLGGRWKWPT